MPDTPFLGCRNTQLSTQSHCALRRGGTKCDFFCTTQKKKSMHVEYNASSAIAILVTTALLLNAMAPTLAHAATYLQGAEVNANTLIRDAYVAVTYYDSKGKQKLEKGWIDEVGETSFTIRSGGIKDKKTIAYEKVLSVFIGESVYSERSTGHTIASSREYRGAFHFCRVLDFEDMQARDSLYAAPKQTFNLNAGEPRTVRMIYFLPNDRPFRQEVVDSMKVTIRQIQTFFAEQIQDARVWAQNLSL